MKQFIAFSYEASKTNNHIIADLLYSISLGWDRNQQKGIGPTDWPSILRYKRQIIPAVSAMASSFQDILEFVNRFEKKNLVHPMAIAVFISTASKTTPLSTFDSFKRKRLFIIYYNILIDIQIDFREIEIQKELIERMLNLLPILISTEDFQFHTFNNKYLIYKKQLAQAIRFDTNCHKLYVKCFVDKIALFIVTLVKYTRSKTKYDELVCVLYDRCFARIQQKNPNLLIHCFDNEDAIAHTAYFLSDLYPGSHDLQGQSSQTKIEEITARIEAGISRFSTGVNRSI